MTKMFSVYDSKVGAYLQPFFMRSKGEALRGFQELANDPNTQFAKYPSDFTLFEIADFEERTGKITPHKAKISLGLALNFVKPAPTQGTLFDKDLHERTNGTGTSSQQP